MVVHELEAAVAEGDHERAVRTLERCSASITEWGLGGDLDRIERVLRELETSHPTDSWVLYLLGWVWFNRRRYELATLTIHQAHDAFRQLGGERAQRGRFLCHLALGMIAQAAGRSEEARASFERALDSGHLEMEQSLSEDEERWAAEDPSGLVRFWLLAGAVFSRMGLRISAARAQHNIGTIVLDMGEPAPARLFMERALELKQSGASELSTALTLNSLGCAERQLGLLQRAASHLGEAVDITRVHRHRTHLSYALNNLAEVRRDSGEAAAAHELYGESLRLKEQEGNTFGIAFTLCSQADLHLMAGEPDRAAELADQALRLRVPGAGVLEETRLRVARARTQLAAYGAVEAAAAELAGALAVFEQRNAKADVMATCWWLAAAHLELGARTKAATLGGRALDLAAAYQLDHVLAGHVLSTPRVLSLVVSDAPGHSSAVQLQALVERSPWRFAPSKPVTPQVSAKLFGPFSVTIDDTEVPTSTWRSKKAVSMLAMLLHEAGDPLHRETAAERLWPEADPDKARRNLNVALSTVRRGLEETVAGGAVLVERHGSYYRLADGGGISTDVGRFRALLQAVNAAERQGDLAAALAGAERALQVADGVYLADELYEEWAQSERSRLAELVLDLRVRAAEWCLGNADTSAAIFHATAALREDPWRERAWSALMRAHADAGDRGAALRAFERCRQVFEEELGLSPSDELKKLAGELQA